MKIGTPKEIEKGEARVAMTPDSARQLQKLGYECLIESGAGDRQTALRWIREAQDEHWRDNDSMSYNFGLPYGYDFDNGPKAH